MYATAADLVILGATETAQASTPDWLRVIPAELLLATVQGDDRSAWTAEEIDAADRALARIEDALAEASAEIDAALSQRYSLPFSGPLWSQDLLRSICRALARWWLADDTERYDDSGRPVSPVADRARWARKFLVQIREGELRLDEVPAQSGAGATVQSTGPGRLFTRDSMKGL